MIADLIGRQFTPSHRSIWWDNHACVPLKRGAPIFPTLEKYWAAGIDVVSLNIGFASMSASKHLDVLGYLREQIMKRPEHFLLIETVHGITECRRRGILGICFDIEGMFPVQADISLIQEFYRMGVRWMLLAYNRSNYAGGGCLDDEDTGLTSLGRAIIDEMSRVGMVLCLSHTGARTAIEALEYSSRPVIFSHSNASHITPHKRNIDNDLIRLCAETGGVVGINGAEPFLGTGCSLLEQMIKHIMHVVNLVGPEHVAIGLDFAEDRSGVEDVLQSSPSLAAPGLGVGATFSLLSPDCFPIIADRLCALGLADKDVDAILGEN